MLMEHDSLTCNHPASISALWINEDHAAGTYAGVVTSNFFKMFEPQTTNVAMFQAWNICCSTLNYFTSDHILI